jgi:acyl-[acyl-carrier-protein]-phospholipid O-acyltransferase / long-chain-fatty-acid--[acyl-carrier-protein] ligase
MNEPCIYIANHTSLLDAVLLYTHLPKDVFFVANTEIAKKYAWAMKGKNIITVDPFNPYSVRNMLKVLNSGKSVVIFPEGRITVTNSLMKIYSGVAYLALKTGVKLVPIGIDGGEKAKLFTYLEDKIPTQWFPSISLYVGEPFTIPNEEGKTMREKKEMGSHLIYRKLQETLLECRLSRSVHLCELLRKKVKEAPNMVIAEDLSGKVTMKQLWRKILAVAHVIDSSVIEERVGVLLPTSIACVVSVFAILYSGKTPAMLNFSMDISSLRSCLETGNISVILTSRAFVEKAKLQATIEVCSKQARILYVEDFLNEVTPLVKTKVLLKEHQKVTSPANDILLFTSGSEGSPKGVLLTHDNIYANIQQVLLMIDLTSKDKIVHVLPMFHSFGLILSFASVLCHVPSLLIPSPLLYKAIPELTYMKKGTILLGTSTFLYAYGRNANPYDFSFVRYVISGGEKLQEHVRTLWMKKFGLRIYEGYGLTETSPILSLQTPLLYKEGSVGCLVPGVKYQLEPVEGMDGGRLKIQAPNLMKGYLLADKGFQKAPEWFDTGDIVTIDEKGFVTIQGRAKQFVKIGGEMISLPAVEQHVKSALGVEEVVALGVKDAKKGERIEVVTTSSTANLNQIRDYWKEHQLSSLSLPTRIHVFSTLPLLGSGKVDRVSIQKQIENMNE